MNPYQSPNLLNEGEDRGPLVFGMIALAIFSVLPAVLIWRGTVVFGEMTDPVLFALWSLIAIALSLYVGFPS